MQWLPNGEIGLKMKRELKVGMRGRVYGFDTAGVNRTGLIVDVVGFITYDWLNVISISRDHKFKIHCRQFIPFKERKPLRERDLGE